MMIYLFALSFWLCSCNQNDDTPVIPSQTEQTVIMFFPWSTNLTSYFLQNIKDFESAIENNILTNERVLVCFSQSPTKAILFELKFDKGKSVRDTLKSYENPAFTTSEGITSVLNDIKTISPANRYAMIIGCHGMGWLPVAKTKASGMTTKFHWDYKGGPMTRFFGGLTSEYQINTTTLAEGITDAGIKMDYILFDDCYMSTIEVAYDLKDVTNYLIACPTEIMAYGFPYQTVAPFLLGDVDYPSVCNAFYDFYSSYSSPYGTIGVTDCAELDRLAVIMKEINQQFTFKTSQLTDIQRMDGYSPVIFFDLGDYVAHLCEDSSLLELFNQQLNRAVPYKAHTAKYYSAIIHGAVAIKSYSGTVVSDPSTNSLASPKEETKWYKATH